MDAMDILPWICIGGFILLLVGISAKPIIAKKWPYNPRMFSLHVKIISKNKCFASHGRVYYTISFINLDSGRLKTFECTAQQYEFIAKESETGILTYTKRGEVISFEKDKQTLLGQSY